MSTRVLVLTTVHHPDDNRIRQKTIRALSAEFDVVYAAPAPGPSDRTGIEVVELAGGRLARNVRAWWLAWTSRYGLVAAHDPELLPLLLLLRVLRRKPAVFDVHEDIPAQLASKPYLPRPVRPPVAWLAARLLAIAERTLVLTLAEKGYRHSFRREHPVIPNHPLVDDLPAPTSHRNGEVCYVGDVTAERGVADAVEAAGRAGVPIRVVGRVGEHFAAELAGVAARHRAVLHLTGRLPHGSAMEVVSRSAVAVSPLRAMPNYLESVPTKVLEYLALGVPVVATDLPATRRTTEGLRAVVLVAPSDPVGMADAIRAAMAPEVLEAALDQVGEVRERFSWDPEVVVAVYRRALGALR